MTLAATLPFLHVANGTCTTRNIEAAGLPGACSIWADPLYEGPVPAGLSDGDLLEVRRQFLAGPGDLTWVAWGANDPSLDPANDLREWRTSIARHERFNWSKRSCSNHRMSSSYRHGLCRRQMIPNPREQQKATRSAAASR